MSESKSYIETKPVQIFLVGADGVRSEVGEIERMDGKQETFIPAFAPKALPYAVIEFMVRKRETESNGLGLVKVMRQGDPFNFEIHAPDGDLLVARSCTFLDVLDVTFMDDPTHYCKVRLRA